MSAVLTPIGSDAEQITDGTLLLASRVVAIRRTAQKLRADARNARGTADRSKRAHLLCLARDARRAVRAGEHAVATEADKLLCAAREQRIAGVNSPDEGTTEQSK